MTSLAAIAAALSFWSGQLGQPVCTDHGVTIKPASQAPVPWTPNQYGYSMFDGSCVVYLRDDWRDWDPGLLCYTIAHELEHNLTRREHDDPAWIEPPGSVCFPRSRLRDGQVTRRHEQPRRHVVRARVGKITGHATRRLDDHARRASL